VTRASLEAAIAQVHPGRTLGDVGAAVQRVAEGGGYSVVREYVGHGIGTAMHEDPQIPNYAGGPNQRFKLKQGHVVAIEPMVNVGKAGTRTLGDGWTVVTSDGARSAHFEHTIACTDDGPEVLTVP
jgi:methionyl aminopeptidase